MITYFQINFAISGHLETWITLDKLVEKFDLFFVLLFFPSTSAEFCNIVLP